MVSVQGSFLEHLQLLRELPGVEVVAVRKAGELEGLDALVIPSGEPTAMLSVMRAKGLDNALIKFAERGGALMGTSAGAVLLAKRVIDRTSEGSGLRTLGLMSIGVLRNAFGRSRDSFVARVHLEEVGEVEAVFVRAPAIAEAWGEARIVAYVDHPATGRVGAAAVERSMLAVAFSPELSGSIALYRYLLSMVKR